MVSDQKICRILLRFFVWKTDSLVMSLSVILQHSKPIVGGHHTALVDLQIFSAWSAVVRGPPHLVEYSEGVSGLVETVLDVIPCSSIMPYCAAHVSELFSCWQVFSVHLNWCRVGHVQQHHSCLLLADPQANLLCVSAESGRLFLHVLVSMGDQS